MVGRVANIKQDDEDDALDGVLSDGEEDVRVNKAAMPSANAEQKADAIGAKGSIVESNGDVPSEHMSTDGNNQTEYTRAATQKVVGNSPQRLGAADQAKDALMKH